MSTIITFAAQDSFVSSYTAQLTAMLVLLGKIDYFSSLYSKNEMLILHCTDRKLSNLDNVQYFEF